LRQSQLLSNPKKDKITEPEGYELVKWLDENIHNKWFKSEMATAT